MKILSASVALAALSLPASETCAGQSILQLPEDGTWVRYTFTTEMTTGVRLRETGTFTISSVGVAVEDDQKCRWIELELRWAGEIREKLVFKFLIPEKDLREGKASATGIVRGWKKTPEGDIRELEALENSDAGSFVATILPGADKNVKKLDHAKAVEYQNGRLECKSALERTIKIKQPPDTPKDYDSRITATYWLHDKVPFGVAAMTGRHTLQQKETVLDSSTTTFLLQDFGSGAKSALPDKQ